ncbi:MAG TPA: LLM class flavin-dependent oxidoreductase [Methylomirabilota bacterium]|nr:LLM class flavin-dependent oxidoreductase [Methylomirabilota bacterium]
MRIAALLTPTPDWDAISAGARLADDIGLDAVGFWDHYHSGQPDWAYVCGWSALGAIAQSTTRVKLLPMVLNNLHYEPGVLAKESSILALASGGRFELGIGAGDWPGSFMAWGRPFPPVDERLDRLVETIEALRLVWTGRPVDYEGRYVQLRNAICTPAPAAPPRVVIGVGGSRRVLHRLIRVADEVNLYAEPDLVVEARDAIAGSGRQVTISVFLSWEWDKWPADPSAELDTWQSAGVDRACVSLAGPDMEARIEALGAWQRAGSA